MRYSFLLLLLTVCFCSNAQPSKKAPVAKTVLNKTAIPVKKFPFLKRSLKIDPAIVSGTSIDTVSGHPTLTLKLAAVKSAIIHITDFSTSSISEVSGLYEKNFDSYSTHPGTDGLTCQKGFHPAIKYDGGLAEVDEYKFIYNGTSEEQKQAKAAEKAGTKPVNKYDTDENNSVYRIYFLNYVSGEDKGFIMIDYQANFGEDKKYYATKIMQSIIDGIAKLKVSDYYTFSKTTDATFLVDMALPAKDGGDGRYNMDNPNGTITLKNFEDASAGYAAIIDQYNPTLGTVTDKTEIEKHTLQNGLTIFSHKLSISWKEGMSIQGREFVTVLVPDKKIIKKPVLFVVRLYNDKSGDGDAINAFILNSISAKGTLTPALIAKVKDSY
ncbi:MAG: hypothetical protein ABIP35_04850 [Ginsengibacter sp.]